MRATKKGGKGEGRDRKNDLYARGVPSAKTITEIKHLAAVKQTTVGDIIHREHGVLRDLREILKQEGGPPGSLTGIAPILAKHGLAPETV